LAFVLDGFSRAGFPNRAGHRADHKNRDEKVVGWVVRGSCTLEQSMARSNLRDPPISYGVGHWVMEPPRRRVLMFAEAVTLAQSLDSARYEVHLVCDPRYLSLFDELGFPVHAIRSINSDVFHDRLAYGSPLYTTTELREHVQEDLRVMTEREPDLVVGDFRLSLSVSARLCGIPYAAVTNAYWSPYARPRFLVPELAMTKRFGSRIAQGLFRLIRPLVFAHHAYAFNKVRREYGLPAAEL